jgi:Protein of unknown function (DUF3079)
MTRISVAAVRGLTGVKRAPGAAADTRPRTTAMTKKFPLHPPHPERNCWGCDQYCKSTDLACGNGAERTQHPVEFFGPDWHTWVPPVEGGAAATADPGPPLAPLPSWPAMPA